MRSAVTPRHFPLSLHHFKRAIAAILVATACVGGGDATPTDPQSAPLASLSLDRTSVSIEQGSNTTLVATVRDATGGVLTGRSISWSSDANAVATVNQFGVITAVAVGTTQIRATSEGKSASAQVVVTPVSVSSISLDRTSVSIEQGSNTTLVATVRDATGGVLSGRSISWSSDANAVATVNQSGVITAVAVGTANVIASSEGKSASAQIQVTPIPVASVVLSRSTIELDIGQTTTLTADARSSSGQSLAGRNIVWASADNTVASVANGVVTAVAPGNTTITATSEGKVGSAAVLVKAPSCASTVATGRLSTPVVGTFVYNTIQGWTVRISDGTIKVLSPNPGQSMFYEWWGDLHESIGGKHIKDMLGDRRTLLLPGGVIVTVHTRAPAAGAPAGTSWLQWISIYEGNESHRIDMQTRSVVQSCALPMFGEAAEHDGETASLFFNAIGLRFENVYQQDASATGVPLAKLFGTVLLAQTYFDNLSRVDDFFDDPRVGHTW